MHEGEAGALKRATLLVAKGADVNAVGAAEADGGQGEPPLFWAAQAAAAGKAGGMELVTLLIENGADVNVVCKVADGKVGRRRAPGRCSCRLPASEAT